MPFSFGFGKGTSSLGFDKFWSPLQLSPSAWLDATDSASVVLTDGVVSQWSDKSGNNRHATQSTAANRPTPVNRYNLVTYSEQFDNAIWTKIGTTVTANAAVAPDGTTTADALIETSTTSQHGINYTASGISIVSGTNYIVSFYLKPNGIDIVNICGDAQNGYLGATTTQVNISTGTVISNGSATAVSMTNVGNGWYRVSATYTATNTTASPGVYLTLSSYAGNGSSGVYIWGAQVVMADVFPANTYQSIAAVGTHNTSRNFPTHLLFDGVNDSLNISSWGNVNQPFTRVVVFSPVTMGAAANKFLLESLSPTATTDIGDMFVANQNTITSGENPYTPCFRNNTYIRISASNGASSIAHTDGTASATYTRSASQYQTGYAIGWDGAGYNGWANVRIWEVLLIPKVLSDDERQKLEGYLAYKYGITNKLQANHPNKASRPTIPNTASSIVTQNLVFHVDAGNASSYSGTGTAWTDLSGGGRHCTLQSGMAYDSNNSGSITFATDKYGTVSGGTAIFAGNQYTKSVWVKFTSISGYKNLISGDGSSHAFWVPENWSGISQKIQSGHNGNWSQVFGNTSVTTNVWYNIVLTFSTTNGFKLYLNGVLDGSAPSATTAMSAGNTAGPLYLGSFALLGNGFNGNMAVAKIYTKELSEAEVTQNYNALKSRFGL